MTLPPNRFRTRSVAIVAGYSPERLYSNVPPGAFVVESGVYKIGEADRTGGHWPDNRPEPIYWRQVKKNKEFSFLKSYISTLQNILGCVWHPWL